MKRNIRKLLISSALVVGFLFLAVPQSVSAITVSGKSCVYFAGQTTLNGETFGWNETDVSIPPCIKVCSWSTVSISATGLWTHTSSSNPEDWSGPGGKAGSEKTQDQYDDLGISLLTTGLDTLVGVFLTDDPPDSEATPAELSTVTTTPALQQAFIIGASLADITVPDGATRLFLGHHDGYEWSNNQGEVEVTATTIVSIDIKPETLNLKSKGVLTAFIELPECYGEEDVDIGTVECEGAPAVNAMMANDGKLIVKFDREDLVGVSPGDAVELTVTGQLTNGTPFAGSDTIRVIDRGGGKK